MSNVSTHVSNSQCRMNFKINSYSMVVFYGTCSKYRYHNDHFTVIFQTNFENFENWIFCTVILMVCKPLAPLAIKEHLGRQTDREMFYNL